MNLERARFRRFPGPLLLGLFVFGALLLLNLAVKRGSAADFYLYAGSAEAFWKGDIRLFVIPPLFPALLGLLGKVFLLFFDRVEAYLWAGRVISWGAYALILLFSQKILRRYLVLRDGESWPLAVLCIFPFSLLWSSMPLTDTPFLALSLGTLSFALEGRVGASALWAFLGTLTRFEGAFLIVLPFLGVERESLRRRWKTFTLFFSLAGVGLLLLWSTLAARVFGEVQRRFFQGGSSFLFLKDPELFLGVLYGNTLSFLPPSYGAPLRWGLLFLLLFLVLWGGFAVFRKSLREGLGWTLSLLPYILFKGYVGKEVPIFAGRRVLPLLWLLLLLGIIGSGKIREAAARLSSRFRLVLGLSLSCLLFFLALLLLQQRPLLFPWVLLFLLLLFWGEALRRERFGGKLLGLAMGLLGVLFCAYSYTRALEEVEKFPNRGSERIAAWYGSSRVGGVARGKRVLFCTHKPSLVFHLGDDLKKRPEMVFFCEARLKPLASGDGSRLRENFPEGLSRMMREEGIDYLAMDFHMNIAELPLERDLKGRVLRGGFTLPGFRTVKRLSWKGRVVSVILEPRS